LDIDPQSLRIEPPDDSLRQRVTVVLRRAISDGRFVPGQRLIEREICDLTGVSRTIVREALRHLESEGLVDSIPNRGPVVANLSITDAREIYEVRESLESLAARFFTSRATEEGIAALLDMHTQLHAAHTSGDFNRMVDVTEKFYDVILTGCGNAHIANILRGVRARVGFLRLTSISQPGRQPASLTEMDRIVRALVARDADEASKASIDHVRNACKAALAALSERQGQA
jgi:DNA-binding GntR family transcriptional regulator